MNASQDQADSSQTLLNLSSLGVLEAALHKKSATGTTPSSSNGSVPSSAVRRSSSSSSSGW